MAVCWLLRALGQRRLKAIRLCSLLKIRNVPQHVRSSCENSELPYHGKRIVVLSRRPLKFSEMSVPVEQMSGEPAQTAQSLSAGGAKRVYVDGGLTIQEFLPAGQIHDLTITRVPVLIGDGIPLFGCVPKDIKLRHISTRQYKSGPVTSQYEIIA